MTFRCYFNVNNCLHWEINHFISYPNVFVTHKINLANKKTQQSKFK